MWIYIDGIHRFYVGNLLLDIHKCNQHLLEKSFVIKSYPSRQWKAFNGKTSKYMYIHEPHVPSKHNIKSTVFAMFCRESVNHLNVHDKWSSNVFVLDLSAAIGTSW